MSRPILAALFAGLTLAATCGAAAQEQSQSLPQPSPPATEGGRYTFHRMGDGFVRLDSTTGQVAQCTSDATGWSCRAAPDERLALESEIARLQRENGVLKKDMLARGLPLPGGVASAPSSPQQRELNLKVPLPSDAEIDRVMSTFEKMWRRLVDMMQKTPGSDKI